MDAIKRTIEDYIKQFGTTGVPFKQAYKELEISAQTLETELCGMNSICQDDDNELYFAAAFDELHG